MFLVDALRDQGYEAIGIGTAREALDLLSGADRRPDLILLDVMLPGLDGLAFSDAYHAMPGPHAPVIAVTASRRAGEAAIQHGAEHALVKPFDLEALLEEVGNRLPPEMPPQAEQAS